ncbi:D-alanyl-D-alanine carboxypeptidase [Paracoccus sp. M683]|uniref:D-alanyl-D-alanine carboxypeptidase family protein n=1 Tax=Paracoccus sp. M683 TaxID=2594268 RepID=UPI001181635C|nr:D-alanyl-D-alanine carboxypeptidase family protein [Paracoccus sp. M683]TRW96797.1 D-alanyl-D-alanine carboxypeptidase [Paracoccus sp. M683]
MRALLFPLVASLTFALPGLTAAQGFDTNARAAWVYDVATGTVLMERNADEALPPASMSKLMTVYMLFEAVREGRVQMDTRLPVSTKARQMGGSTMFLNEQDRPTVEELIKGIIVLSGNDACVVVAEGLAGTEDAFARQMTEKGRELGLTNSTFANASGWPDPRHRMTAHDLGILAQHLVEDFPELYKYFALTEYPFDNRAPSNRFNRNPLLKLGIGADGLKTGHTQEAGYGLTGSAVQGSRRVIFVLNGLASEAARAEEAERIVSWAFRQFTMKTLVPKGETVVEAPVWLGDKSRVALTTKDGLNVLIPGGAADRVTAEVVYNSPIPAPIKAGQQLGELVVTIPGTGEARMPLLAATDVAEAGFVGRIKGAALQLGGRAIEATGL